MPPDPMALAALAGGAPPSPASPTGPEPMEPDADDGMGDPEQEDKVMLVEDFRNARPEDALAAFEALLSAFNVKRGGGTE